MEMTYTRPRTATSMSKSLTVVIDDTATAAAALPQGNSTKVLCVSTSAPPPPFTTGKITKIEYVVSTWLIWFNGVRLIVAATG